MTTRKRQSRPKADPVTVDGAEPKAEPEVAGKVATVTVLSSSVTYRTQTGGRGIARRGDTITVPAGVAERLIAANAAK